MSAIHHQVRDQLYQKYDQDITQGKYLPLTSTSLSLGLLLFFCFFLIPPASSFHNRFTRYTVFAVVLLWHTYLVTCYQAKSVAVVYGAGISSAWGTLWAATLLVFRDAKTDFRRLERRKVGRAELNSASSDNGSVSPSSHVLHKKGDESNLRRRARLSEHGPETDNQVDKNDLEYIWQSYPTNSTFWHRLRWNADLLTNFRGSGWSWRISGLPSLPLQVQEPLSRTSASSSSTEDSIKDVPVSHIGIQRYDSLPPLLKHNVLFLIRHYLTIDLILTLMHHDPYFYSGVHSTPAPSYLASVLAYLPHALVPVLVKIYRLLLSMLMVSTCLKFACALGPPTFCYLLSASSSPLRNAPYPFNKLAFMTISSSPWLYPDAFGPYSNVLSRGLAGWWGAWWHQLFRFAFQSAGEFAVDGVGVDRKSMLGKVVQAIVVFFVSGCVHASGSLMLSARSEGAKPVTGAMLFFMVQPIGIMIEMGVRAWWKQATRGQEKDKETEKKALPVWVLGAVRFVWVHVWFYFTAGLLVDDFARSGVWTFEPLSVSIFRGLGMGVQGDGWWCWGGGAMTWWYDGGHRWWLTGFAF